LYVGHVALVLVDLAAEDGESQPLQQLGSLFILRLTTAEQIQRRSLSHHHTCWNQPHQYTATNEKDENNEWNGRTKWTDRWINN